ncbi:MAG: NAD(P)H-hydrate dehydratase [Erysipelotrichaceae bacterium]|nr:NAD(P)H-hydrate dehydratase [Erysipelotrichaceae bacterium]
MLKNDEIETVSYDYDEIRNMIPVRYKHSHKGDYGKVLLIGGHDNTVGACIMCARTILKSGAGLLTIMSYLETVRTAHEVLPEAMTITMNPEIIESQLAELNMDNYSLIVFGPGAGRNEITEKLLVYVLKQDRDVILDADGLYYLKKHIDLLNRSKTTVITPHLGEYKRVFEYDRDKILSDLTALSEKYPTLITVLKGVNTLIAYQGHITVNRTGNNALAKGGSGDVLCGLTGGLFAQKPDVSSVIAAVYIHSLAADYWVREHSSYSLLASDLIEQIDKILFEMQNE